MTKLKILENMNIQERKTRIKVSNLIKKSKILPLQSKRNNRRSQKNSCNTFTNSKIINI